MLGSTDKLVGRQLTDGRTIESAFEEYGFIKVVVRAAHTSETLYMARFRPRMKGLDGGGGGGGAGSAGEA